MSAKTTELEGTTVMLTLRNAVDQTRKVAIEVPAGSTVRDAVIEAEIAQGESFDVFTAEGRTVTRDSVEDHGDGVLYVGPQNVAGGAMEVDEVPRKAIHFAHSIDPSVRSDVIPGDGQTVRQAAEVAGLTPRDGSPWDVFDYLGNVVNDLPAADMIGESLYVGPESFRAGAMALSEPMEAPWSKAGLDNHEINKAKIFYPSIKTVRSHRMPNGNNGVIILVMNGVVSEKDGKRTDYELIVDAREFPFESPRVFVMTPECSQIKHCNIYRSDNYNIAPAMDICPICLGPEWQEAYDKLVKKRTSRLLAFLNHIQNVLSTPNEDDKARRV